MADQAPYSTTPLFRWPGSKWHLVAKWAPRLRAHLDATGGRLVSLFYGSGALEQVGPARLVAAEANPELRILYGELQRDSGAAVLAELVALDRSVGRTRESYLAVRALSPSQPAERAARFLWLSGLAWNGLWRVNRAGQFNVPCDPARLQRPWPFPSALALEAAKLRGPHAPLHADWRDALALAQPGDLVLADPPYVDGFDAYCAGRFALAQQQELAARLADAARVQIAVIAFNAPGAASLYRPWASISRVHRSGRINSRCGARGPVRELVAVAGLLGSARPRGRSSSLPSKFPHPAPLERGTSVAQLVPSPAVAILPRAATGSAVLLNRRAPPPAVGVGLTPHQQYAGSSHQCDTAEPGLLQGCAQ